MASLNGTTEKEEIQQDVVQEAVGDFGRWQLRITILMSLLKLPMAWFQLVIVFLALPTTFWCNTPSGPDTHHWKVHAEPNVCHMKNESTTGNNYSEIPCDWGYSYDQNVTHSSIIAEWNLVCESERMVEVTQITFMLGAILGNIFFGIVSDRYGRKTALLISIGLQGVCGVISSLAPWLWAFILFRFLQALGNGGTMMPTFVMCMEVVGGPYRTIVPILFQIPYTIGNMIMAVIAFVLRDWRTLNLVLSLLSCLFITYFWFIPESPRWLLAVGQREKAIKILQEGAKCNKRPSSMPLTAEKADHLNNKDLKKPKFSSLFSIPELRKRTCLLSLNWLILGVVFFALAQFMGNIGSNVYLSVMAAGSLSIPGTILCVYVIRKAGRKRTVALANLITALSVAGIIFFPKGQYSLDWPRLALAACGFTGLAISTATFYLFTGELYPTILRNTGVGGTLMFSKLGSVVAPMVLALREKFEVLPVIVLAVLSVLGLLLVLPLPETHNCALPDTIQDVENQVDQSKNNPQIVRMPQEVVNLLTINEKQRT